MSEIDPLFLKYINSQRIRILKYVMLGINDIDDLAHLMITGRNVIKRHAKLLETIGLLNIKCNTLELNKTPRNLALLYSIGVIDEKDFFKMTCEYVLSIIEKCCKRVGYEDVNVYFSGDGGLLIETEKKLDEGVRSKIAEKILKELSFTYIHFK